MTDTPLTQPLVLSERSRKTLESEYLKAQSKLVFLRKETKIYEDQVAGIIVALGGVPTREPEAQEKDGE